MEIDCVLTVECLGEEGRALPDTVFFFVDPNWRGAWVKRAEGQPLVFHVKYTMKRTPTTSTLRRPYDGTLNTSVKVHFFTPKADAQERTGRKTNVGDFCFSSAFPLEELLHPSPGQAYGVWNPNLGSCDSAEGLPLEGFKLRLEVRRQTVVPRDIRLLAGQAAPSPETHRAYLDTCHWLRCVLNKLYPSSVSTSFSNPRTYSRDPWSDSTFFDIHKLFTTEADGTNLPPSLALYALVNALLVNGLSLDYMDGLLSRQGVIQTKAEANQLVLLVKDCLMCFMWCGREGMYRADGLWGKVVEDQPHTQAQTEEGTDTVIGQDDCEGRAQQGAINIKQLFISIAGLRVGSLRQLLMEIRLQPLMQGLEEADLRALWRLAVCIGRLFVDGVLDAVVCVGDCGGGKMGVKKGGSMGHEVGYLFFDQKAPALQRAVVLESTTNEYKVLGLSKSVPYLRGLGGLSRLTMQNVSSVVPRMPHTAASEDTIFERMYMGSDMLIFTLRDGRLEFGAAPSLLDTLFVRYRPGVPLPGTSAALLVHPQIFMEELCVGGGLWPSQKDAVPMLEKYAGLERQMASFNRVLRPPQDIEDEYVWRMDKHWGRLSSAMHILRRENRDMTDTFHFSVLRGPLQPAVSEFLDGLGRDSSIIMQRHPFMQSLVYSLSFPA
jgi:hypothetical protein